MTQIDPRAAEKLQTELMSEEKLCWAGMPNTNVIFHSDDWTAIPFTVVWTGFFVFCEADALGYGRGNSGTTSVDVFSVLWGIPFLLIGNYYVWGRFLVDAWAKRRTYYGLTNRRTIIVREGWNGERNLCTRYLDFIPSMEREGNKVGTLWFGPKYPVVGSRGSKRRSMSRFDLNDETAVFADIENVEAVYGLALELKRMVGRAPRAEGLMFQSLLGK